MIYLKQKYFLLFLSDGFVPISDCLLILFGLFFFF